MFSFLQTLASYDIYCKVLDEAEAEKDLADEILLDDAWFCDEMLDSPGNQDPNIGLLVNAEFYARQPGTRTFPK